MNFVVLKTHLTFIFFSNMVCHGKLNFHFIQGINCDTAHVCNVLNFNVHEYLFIYEKCLVKPVLSLTRISSDLQISEWDPWSHEECGPGTSEAVCQS